MIAVSNRQQVLHLLLTVLHSSKYSYSLKKKNAQKYHQTPEGPESVSNMYKSFHINTKLHECKNIELTNAENINELRCMFCQIEIIPTCIFCMQQDEAFYIIQTVQERSKTLLVLGFSTNFASSSATLEYAYVSSVQWDAGINQY